MKGSPWQRRGATAFQEVDMRTGPDVHESMGPGSWHSLGCIVEWGNWR